MDSYEKVPEFFFKYNLHVNEMKEQFFLVKFAWKCPKKSFLFEKFIRKVYTKMFKKAFYV